LATGAGALRCARRQRAFPVWRDDVARHADAAAGRRWLLTGRSHRAGRAPRLLARPRGLRVGALTGVPMHLMEEISERGMDAVMSDVVAEARAWDHLFISFDIDVCDPAFAPGTGTPEPGGITAREALRAVRRLAWEVGFDGMEVVEVSPPYDHAEITAFLANRL